MALISQWIIKTIRAFEVGDRRLFRQKVMIGNTYSEEAVARSICSSSGDEEENQPAIVEGSADTQQVRTVY